MRRYGLPIILALIVLIGSSVTETEASSAITFADPVYGDKLVGLFDWTVDNALAIKAVPLPEQGVKQFNLVYQGSLATFSDENGHVIPVSEVGLNSDYEITVVLGFTEQGFQVNSFGSTFASFSLVNSAFNYFEMYYDTSKNHDSLNGTGYTDGILLMKGTITYATGNFAVTDPTIKQDLDQFISNDYPGTLTLVGSGSTQLQVTIDVTSINHDFFPEMPSALVLSFNTSTVTPFKQTDPAKQVWNGSGYQVPVFGSDGTNTVNGVPLAGGGDADFLFQADANSSVELTPVIPPGQCRMTGGHVKFYDDGTSQTLPGDVDTYKVLQLQVKKGKTLQTQNQVTWYTTGGQIGAPQAACLSTPDTAFGNWQHVHHAGSVSWNGSVFTGGFAFHSGTASAPDEAYIKCITCADPGWCVQARCAPFKQIFWEGTGVFHNIDAGTNFPNDGTTACPTPKTAGKNKPPTIHYYRAHVGDFGEPAGSAEQQKPADQCGWTSSGVSILNGAFTVPPTVLPWPLDDKFGYKGGQDCSSYQGCTKCGSCPDWYEIEIHCTANPTSPIIYKVGNFITHGNFQLHPEVGEQCPCPGPDCPF